MSDITMLTQYKQSRSIQPQGADGTHVPNRVRIPGDLYTGLVPDQILLPSQANTNRNHAKLTV